MANPWDPPAFPRRGDHSNKPLYESIGRTLSNWEEAESALSELYAAFKEKARYNRRAHHEYGAAASFIGRIHTLKQAACSYAVKYPSQDREGEFLSITKLIEGWVNRRNDVAHGLVRPIHVSRDGATSEIEWCLVPPEFKEAKYIGRDRPKHILSSHEIGSFGMHFLQIMHRVNSLTEIVELRRHALRRKRVGRPAPKWRRATLKRT